MLHLTHVAVEARGRKTVLGKRIEMGSAIEIS